MFVNRRVVMATRRREEAESTEADVPKTIPSARKGRKGFVRGISGNPNGRPRGSKNKVPSYCQDLIDEHAPEIIAKAVELALEDDNVRAIKFLLDRLVPPKKSAPLTLDLPETRTAEEVLAAFGAVEESLRRGDITTDELRVVVEFLESKRRVIEDADLAERVARLEAHMGASS